MKFHLFDKIATPVAAMTAPAARFMLRMTVALAASALAFKARPHRAR